MNIFNSTLLNTSFQKVDLDKFQQINIFNSTIDEVNFYSTPIPDNIISMSPKGERNYSDEYENYRQIKMSFSNSLNKLQEFDINRNMFERFRKSNNLKKQDKLILFLNKISNNHGSSICRPLWVTAFISVLLSGILFLLNNTQLDLTQLLHTEFILLNPFHRIQEISNIYYSNQDPTTSILIISFLSRILISWIYYQFVTAFRRFGKNI